MKIKFPFFVILLYLFSLGCDKVEGPYNEIAVPPIDTVLEVKQRKILIEDFTGHKCPNCPRAAEAIKSLHDLRPGRIIAIGEHVTSVFAAPGSGIYNIDFRTPTGNTNDSLFNLSAVYGLPIGMINRLNLAGARGIVYGKWSEVADSLLNVPADAYITINTTYDATSRTVTAIVASEFLTSLNGTYKLAVYLTEDSIVHAQKDNLIPTPSNDSSYVHNHVLRGSINGTFGELLTSGPVAATTSFTKTYTRVLNANWKEKHCAVVAFIYDDITKAVLQAEEREVIF